MLLYDLSKFVPRDVNNVEWLSLSWRHMGAICLLMGVSLLQPNFPDVRWLKTFSHFVHLPNSFWNGSHAIPLQRGMVFTKWSSIAVNTVILLVKTKNGNNKRKFQKLVWVDVLGYQNKIKCCLLYKLLNLCSPIPRNFVCWWLKYRP